MIRMELSENLREINRAEADYQSEIVFFKLLNEKRNSLRTIETSVLEENTNTPSRVCDLNYSEDALEVLKTSALMQQITDKQFTLKLLQAYKQCRIIKSLNDFYYQYKENRMNRYLNDNIGKARKTEKDIYDIWENMLLSPEFRIMILVTPNTFDENPFIPAEQTIQEAIRLIEEKY